MKNPAHYLITSDGEANHDQRKNKFRKFGGEERQVLAGLAVKAKFATY